MSNQQGTSNFTNFDAAVRYYRDYVPNRRIKYVREWVQNKLEENEIRIGKPTLGSAIACTVNDEGRYILHYA